MRNLTSIFLLCLSLSVCSQTFTAETLPDSVFGRMQGLSWPEGCTMKRGDLRYLRLSHIDENGKEHIGEMVCNRQIAQSLLRVFRKLYEARYPIHSIRLIDDFGADDEASMTANNTSCFCFRTVAGSNKLSSHSRGLAIDINPLYNPHVRTKKNNKDEKTSQVVIVSPKAAAPYANRNRSFQMKIDRNDLAYKLLREEGFKWGGLWKSSKDYQHFEK
ncbi:MAG: M15 family metallopeptidase [Bacteroidaceae bacterium]|nr:M15 family metallopeptidase [Bacteroidaceae bacterium]